LPYGIGGPTPDIQGAVLGVIDRIMPLVQDKLREGYAAPQTPRLTARDNPRPGHGEAGVLSFIRVFDPYFYPGAVTCGFCSSLRSLINNVLSANPFPNHSLQSSPAPASTASVLRPTQLVP
jgi:hypothetical protein